MTAFQGEVPGRTSCRPRWKDGVDLGDDGRRALMYAVRRSCHLLAEGCGCLTSHVTRSTAAPGGWRSSSASPSSVRDGCAPAGAFCVELGGDRSPRADDDDVQSSACRSSACTATPMATTERSKRGRASRSLPATELLGRRQTPI